MYINSTIRTLKGRNAFTDSGRLMGLAEAATEPQKVSEEISTVKKLYDLGMKFKTVPIRFTMPTLPTDTDPLNGNHLIPKPTDADKLWAMIRNDVPFDKGGTSGSASPSHGSEHRSRRRARRGTVGHGRQRHGGRRQ